MADTPTDATKRFLDRIGPGTEEDDEPDESGDEYRAFARVRGERRQAVMLELRRATGESVAFLYPCATIARYDPAGRVILDLGRHTVTLSGRNLRPLYAGLLTHTVRWVQEADRSGEMLSPDAATVVWEIAIVPPLVD